MKSTDFNQLKLHLAELQPRQRHELLMLLQQPDSFPELIARLEELTALHPTCPHCRDTPPYKWGCMNGRQRYRCRVCKRTFNSLTGTPLSRLRMAERWLGYAELMMASTTLRYAAKQCQINLGTSFRWRHRFLQLVDYLKSSELAGIVEADETMIRESFKGKRKLTKRAPRRRGSDKKNIKWVKVMVLRDRHRNEADFVLKRFTLRKLELALLPRLQPDAVLCSDGHLNYEALAAKHHLLHKFVNSSAGQRVREEVFHIQGVNAYHSRLKQWMHRFHGVATKYLHRYLGWFRWFEQTRKSDVQPIDFIWQCAVQPRFQQFNRT
ncbi:IS1595 family transposase [Oceanimonas smirnovii]|uniref:IS1595 family transposase n=1 Tax=Oceanimonas smirnovii TaxID=264574 RepID=UPI003FD39D59